MTPRPLLDLTPHDVAPETFHDPAVDAAKDPAVDVAAPILVTIWLQAELSRFASLAVTRSATGLTVSVDDSRDRTDDVLAAVRLVLTQRRFAGWTAHVRP